jgi:hypothetical protein
LVLKQACLAEFIDSARKDCKKTWDAARDDMRREINAELEDIDQKNH